MSKITAMLQESQKFIESRRNVGAKSVPEIALVLGSGLGGVVDIIENKTVISYKDIPHFPVSTVHGHAGHLVFGKLGGKDIVAMQGRVHFYEGNPMTLLTYPVRLMKQLGCSKLILTSAVGGINPAYAPGDVVIITDHINFMGTNPLIGEHSDEFGERFPDMSRVYSARLCEIALAAAKKMNIRAHTGVYFASTGPSDGVS
ncbi:MAG: purine-nucleoside phosphorylase [Endomicrobiia bacterium]|nr:purine-nucleoside phosphorylase [Endomicrobiia bacterium]